MQKNLQWEVKVSINAPVEKVWDATQDISLISTYHPEVEKVELLSGNTKRAPGVEYRCIIPEGRPRSGSCVEKVIENIKYEKTTILAVEDTWGLSEMLKHYITEVIFEKKDENTTILHLLGYYEPIGLKVRIMNTLFLKRIMKKRGREVLMGVKGLIEKDSVNKKQELINMKNRPTGISIVAIIFFFLAILSLIIGMSIIIPNTPLDVLWTLKNSFPPGFKSTIAGMVFGYFLVILGLIIFYTGWGLLKGHRWAWWIAVILLGINGISGVISFALGNFGEILGIIIIAGFLFYLTRPGVREFF